MSGGLVVPVRKYNRYGQFVNSLFERSRELTNNDLHWELSLLASSLERDSSINVAPWSVLSLSIIDCKATSSLERSSNIFWCAV